MKSSTRIVLERLAKLLEPRKRQNIWQWADENRFLAKGVSAKSEHGDARYHSADAPHQREPQESFTDPSVQMTVLIMASQIGGKTEIYNNVIGYHMDYKQASIVVMYPTIETAEKFSKNKLSPAINATECLAKVASPDRKRTSGSTILQKNFIGGSIYIVGSNSTSSLRGAFGPVLLGDEIDDYEFDIGGQGDPLDLLWKRGESYPNVVKGLASTPTVQGNSRIWSHFEASDQRFWFMPCPHCGKEIIFKKSHASKLREEIPFAYLDYEQGNTQSARLICNECSGIITDSQRLEMYFAGKWKPTAPFSGIRGYHLNYFYCPWPAHKGFANRLHEFAEEWERAKKKGPTSLKVAINTALCECWEAEYEKPPDHSALILRCQTYANLIPEEVCYLTGFVDVQSDRLELEWVGWGIGEECWGIETKKLFGNPFQPSVWEELDVELRRTFDHPSGAKMKLSCVLIDSGGQSDNRAFSQPVYRFVIRRQSRYVFAAKGSSEIGAPLVAGKLQKNGVMLQMIGTDVCKSTVYERLNILIPGPLYCHFPQGRGYDEEYFKQLTAEAVTQVKGKNSTKRMWVKQRARNEALDMRAGNIAAFEIRNPNLEAISENLRKQVDPSWQPKPAEKPPEQQAALVAPPKPQPRSLFPRRRVGFVAGWK